MNVARILLAAGLLVAAAACSEKPAPKVPLGRPNDPGLPRVDTSPEAIKNNPHSVMMPAAKAALDSGNALYRAGKYQLALTKYRAAAKLAPANAAPYYGMFMAADKLGNKALADSAAKAVAARDPSAPGMFSDTLMKRTHTPDSGKN